MLDFALQGKVRLGDNINGKPGAMYWVGDAELMVKSSASEEKRKESYSGNRNTSATMHTGTEVSFTLKLRYALSKNLALGLYGNVNIIAAGSATGETLPLGLVAGDQVQLEGTGISALAIQDSAGTPVPLVLDTNYKEEDLAGGIIEILDPGSLTQPFTADYDYGASVDVAMFTQKPPVRYMSLVGTNAVDGATDQMRWDFYRAKFNPVATLDLISDKMVEISLDGTLLIDSNNEADSALGGYGRLRQIGATS
ncbi:hypothetical protein PVT67_15630 [Gallaecimonas kandeliae]|uniref:phage tail tube protein n=1 Tax=Gallaecimonas kandeliae TaxID=3029055 RepID=UPI00264745CF|nr:hypothetical protein [Gallaecimonas kandeliae]WKE65073.1 hypothetical protein PVT67_15630 [Gallaecimonas kandeliae]